MKRIVGIVLAASVIIGIAGCGEKLRELKKATDAMQDLSKSAEKMKETTDESQKFYADRKAKGDTLAMDYKALQEFLPKEISGYKPDGGPSGSKSAVQGFSISTAEQSFVSLSGDTTNPARIKVTLADYGGTEGAYGLASLALSFAMSSEDDHHRTGTKKFDIPYTAGIEEYNKDSKDAKISIGTRYRYWINVEATNQKDDQSAVVSGIAEDVAKKLTDK